MGLHCADFVDEPTFHMLSVDHVSADEPDDLDSYVVNPMVGSFEVDSYLCWLGLGAYHSVQVFSETSVKSPLRFTDVEAVGAFGASDCIH